MPIAPHTLSVPAGSPAPQPLPLGGTSPRGSTIAANSAYLTLDGQPWLPVMGEFHFSRYPRADWETELRKMRAGGITVAATYLFWIHHEEIEGQFHWSGSKDIRHFVQLCGDVGLYAYPRIGPWAHGECRNGGFPDWLLERCGKDVRRDVQPYLGYAQRFYREIARQLRGLLWQDGGPIIGFQIENELLDNAGHIQTLLEMAKAEGLTAPLYTMTGWGPAEVPPGAGIIPVFGGYPDAFWERQVQTWARDSRKHYFYTHLRDDNTIGADLNRRQGVTDLRYLEAYPYGTCELGGGMQIAYHRRPFIEPGDVAAVAQVKIGSGSNIQGYYMYHGGANPLGQRSTLQESQATGYWNDVPVINYDFQAPLGQYGQARPAYHALRLLHLFLEEMRTTLPALPPYLPDVTPASLDDVSTLRWAVRSDGRRGFVFWNTYQRVEALREQRGVQFQINLPGETLLLPAAPVDISSGLHAVWPFNMPINGLLLRYATAQLAFQIEVDSRPVVVFVAQPGIAPEFAFAAPALQRIEGPGQQAASADQVLLRDLQPGTGCWFELQAASGAKTALLVLDPQQALRLWKFDLLGQQRVILCDSALYASGERLFVQTRAPGNLELAVYPPVPTLAVAGQAIQPEMEGVFARFSLPLAARLAPAQPPQARSIRPAGQARTVPIGPLGVAQAPETADFEQAAHWQIDLPAGLWENLANHPQSGLFLRIHYSGDAARLYAGDILLDDQFYYGAPWEIDLRRFHSFANRSLTLKILPLRRDAPIYLPAERWPDFHGAESVAELHRLEWIEYQTVVVEAVGGSAV